MRDTNGDKIYKKTIRQVFNSSTRTYSGSIDPGVPNIKRFIDMTGMVYVLNATSGSSPTNYLWTHRIGAVYGAGSEFYGMYFRDSDKVINVNMDFTANRSACVEVTIYYTKTAA